MNNFKTSFLTQVQAQELAARYGTPLFVYSREVLRQQAKAALQVRAPYGLTVRYAMKANPNPDVLAVFKKSGLNIDASSGYEAALALECGFSGRQILLTSQQLAHNLTDLVEAGVQFNATSLHQLEAYAKAFPGTDVTVRLNPGIGSGHSLKVTVGGAGSSFGIWHEYIPRIHELTKRYRLRIVRIHTHIGSGSDPEVWQQAAKVSLSLTEQFPEAKIINLGGGFKVARMSNERATDMSQVGRMISAELERFYEKTNRKLKLELEPGTYVTANAGALLAKVEDIVDTGKQGYTFLKLNTGMNDILRPSLYGAQHPISMLNHATKKRDYVVVGHNCESGDLLTPSPGKPEVIATRRLPEAAIGDLVLIGGAGAYCASMATQGYNSYPPTPAVMV